MRVFRDFLTGARVNATLRERRPTTLPGVIADMLTERPDKRGRELRRTLKTQRMVYRPARMVVMLVGARSRFLKPI